MIRSLLFFILVVPAIFPKIALAETNSYVSVVNPVRISVYNPNPGESLKAEYDVVLKNNLPATWLLTYDAIDSHDVIQVIQIFNEDQEIGVFFEISEKLCDKAGVVYDKSYSWHHAANIFLTGYTQKDRIKLIDTVFEKFKTVFGYYPKSVGAWWIDAFSLDYMHQKYGITANLGLADQYSTDGYRVWGTYWSTPFYPSKKHAGIPGFANSKIDVLTMQWAPRDPLNGYFNSYYSTQDYLQGPVFQNTQYFENLINVFKSPIENSVNHVVVGLESDLDAKSYTGEYFKQLQVVKRKYDLDEVRVVNMDEFSNIYSSSEKTASLSPSNESNLICRLFEKAGKPDRKVEGECHKKNSFNENQVHFIESHDILGKSIKTFWYQSSNYRIGINYNTESQNLEVFDLRVYQSNFQEPYYQSTNRDFRLLINIPSIIDNFVFKNSWKLNLGELLEEKYEGESVKLIFSNGEIILNHEKTVINALESKTELTLPGYVANNRLLDVQRNNGEVILTKSKLFQVDEGGYVFNNLKPEVKNFFKSKRGIISLAAFVVILMVILKLIGYSKFSPKYKTVLVIVFFGCTSYLSRYWINNNSITYFASQAEIDALNHLNLMNDGKVLIYEKECLGCVWNSTHKPAVYDNLRNYVQKYSNKKIVYNKSVFEAVDQKTAKYEFDKTQTKYIYVVNYENYKEKVPFSPGDLGIELVYENANSQIWQKTN